MTDRLRVAFVKFAGLSAGGTERWLQMMAAGLPRDRFAVDFLWSAAAPYIGSDFRHPDTYPDRLAYMEQSGVNLIEFHVGAKDVTTPTHDWVDTDFWERFDPDAYDLVVTGKAGPAEYPFDRLSVPVVEFVALSAGVDRSGRVASSIHCSQWLRRGWVAEGGDPARSAVIPVPARPPVTQEDRRAELGLPADALIAGFHQRAEDAIFSPIPLEAFARVAAGRADRFFVLLGGGSRYHEQAAALGLENALILPHGDSSAEGISRFLNTLDVFAHGRADGETFGTVLAEAMAHGLPCLSHASPINNAQPETMGPAGLWVDGVDAYAEALGRLFDEPALRAELAAEAAPHAQHYYSLERCVQRLADLLEAVAAQRPQRAGPPLPYGQSDLGFLLAGPVEDTARAAHSVLTGGIPDEPVVSLVRALLPSVGRVRQLGGEDALAALVAAQAQVPATVLGTTPGEALDATLRLNRWSGRVAAEQIDVAANLGSAALGAADDLVAVESTQWLAPTLRLLEAADALRPMLLARLDLPADRVRIEELGYRAFAIGRHRASGRPRPPRAGWHLFLHPAHHRDAHARLVTWNTDRAKARRRRALAELAPGRLRERQFRARLALLHARESRRLRRQPDVVRSR